MTDAPRVFDEWDRSFLGSAVLDVAASPLVPELLLVGPDSVRRITAYRSIASIETLAFDPENHGNRSFLAPRYSVDGKHAEFGCVADNVTRRFPVTDPGIWAVRKEAGPSATHPDEDFIAVALVGSPTLTFFGMWRNDVFQEWRVALESWGEMCRISFNQTGDVVAMLSTDERLLLQWHEFPSCKWVREIDLGALGRASLETDVEPRALLFRGPYVLAGAARGAMIVTATSTKPKTIHRFQLHKDLITDAVWHPTQANTLITSSLDGTIGFHVWIDRGPTPEIQHRRGVDTFKQNFKPWEDSNRDSAPFPIFRPPRTPR